MSHWSDKTQGSKRQKRAHKFYRKKFRWMFDYTDAVGRGRRYREQKYLPHDFEQKSIEAKKDLEN